jgi:hypothetical protein
MTTDVHVRVIFLLKSVLGAHFVNVRLWAGKLNTSSAYARSDKNDIIKYVISIYDYC